MSVGGIAGFWSYSHDDDKRDGHGLTRLAARIQDEYALVTGETLTLFVDRKDISWGEEWRRRIGTALVETTFFIPVITPLYFKQPECRRELLSFVGQAQSLGAIELVMPILYIEVPGLTEDSSDEARALIARMQYIDWHEIRLNAEFSAEYRRGVNSLARRLAEIASKYEQAESRAIGEDADNLDEDGLLELLATVEQKFSEWEEELDRYEMTGKQLDIVRDSYLPKIKKADNRGSSGPLLIVLRGLYNDIEPLIKRVVEHAKHLAAISIELDPEVLKILRMLEVYPEASERVLQALAPINHIVEDIEADKHKRATYSSIAKYKGVSKDIAKLVRLGEVEIRYLNDAESLVMNWNREMANYK